MNSLPFGQIATSLAGTLSGTESLTNGPEIHTALRDLTGRGVPKGFLHAINRGANAGDDIACNTHSRRDRRRTGLDGPLLRMVTSEVLALNGELRKATIERVMETSNLELGLQALMRTPSSGQH